VGVNVGRGVSVGGGVEVGVALGVTVTCGAEAHAARIKARMGKRVFFMKFSTVLVGFSAIITLPDSGKYDKLAPA